MRRDIFPLIIFLLLLTALILPGRNSSSQDDAAYAYSVLSLQSGDRPIHAGTIAMNFTQFALGLTALKIFPSVPALSLLNFMSWLAFCASVLLFARFSKISWVLIIAFFSFPLWIQYGSIYHGEVYSLLLLVSLIGLISNRNYFQRPWVAPVLGIAFSFLLGTQLQNMAAFPFFWGVFLILRRQTLFGSSLIVGAIASSLAFFLMPKTPYQYSYAYWLTQNWITLGSAAPKVFLTLLLQLIVALGLFLIPMVSFRNRSWRDWLYAIVVQFAVFILTYMGGATLSAGLFFTDYYPRWIAVLFSSFGIWGYWGVWPAFREMAKSREDSATSLPWEGTLAALLVMVLFCTYRFTTDLRYLMSWSIPIVFHFREHLRFRRDHLGGQLFFLAPLLIISILLNLFLLNTTDARWQTAAELHAQGIPKNQIAAGYGWNTFFTANDCMYKTISKLERELGAPIWHRREFFDRFINLYGRNHEDGWVARYVLKPSKVFGAQINLKKHRLVGQDTEPVRYIDYNVLGIPCQLALFENRNPQDAWCDRP